MGVRAKVGTDLLCRRSLGLLLVAVVGLCFYLEPTLQYQLSLQPLVSFGSAM